MTKIQNPISILLAIAAAYAAHISGLWVDIGAHPGWSQTATIIGALIGLALLIAVQFALIKMPSKSKFLHIGLAALVIVAYVATTIGKREFVNSFAENDLAGLFWYYGFIAFVGFLISALALLFGKLQNKIKGA